MQNIGAEIRRLRGEIHAVEDGHMEELEGIIENSNLFDNVQKVAGFAVLRRRMLIALDKAEENLKRRTGETRSLELSKTVIFLVEETGFENCALLRAVEQASHNDTPEVDAEHCDKASDLAGEYIDDSTPEKAAALRKHLQGGELMTEKVPHKREWVWTAGMATMVIVASMCVAGVLLAWCITGGHDPAPIPPAGTSRVIGEPAPAAVVKPPFVAPATGLSAPAGKTEPAVPPSTSDTSGEFEKLRKENEELREAVEAAAKKPASETKAGTPPRKSRTSGSGGSSRAGSRPAVSTPASARPKGTRPTASAHLK